MEFLIPLAKSKEESESVYGNIASFVGASVKPTDERLYSITYYHNGETMVATVDDDCSPYYKESVSKVIAIFKGDPYKICLPNRGVVRGEPILVGASKIISESFFD